MTQKVVLMAAGASGGHVFPALAVAEVLRERGYTPVFVMGGGKFGHVVEAAGFPVEKLPAAAFSGRGPWKVLVAAFKLVAGLWKAMRLVRTYKPVAAFGTGGYATVAALLAAKMGGVRTVIHNADSLLGRANRFLARMVDKVLVSFEGTTVPAGVESKVVVTGLPLRADVRAARGVERKNDGVFHLLVLGGSQGSAVLGALVPMTLRQMERVECTRMAVVHQARPQDVAMLKELYAGLGLKQVEVKAFFDDLPVRYVAANLIVGRAGANTIMEAAMLGRAAIYCPHRLADNHQLHNARLAEQAGAAVVMEEPDFTPEHLKKVLRDLMDNPKRLAAMESGAFKMARADAAAACADEVVGTAVL